MPSRMLAFLTMVAAGACGVAANPATTGPASDASVASNDAGGTGSNADTGNIFAYAALSVHYCQTVDDAHKLVSRVANISPDQAGAYPCSLSLTFSNIPLCGDYTPASPFQLLTLSLSSVAPATYGLADLAQAATASPLAYAQCDTYGDPSWCSHQQPSGGALSALGSGVYSTAGSVTIAAFVDGGSASKVSVSR